MITSRIKVFDYFPQITEAVDRLAEEAVQAAAEEAAAVAKSIGGDRNATDIRIVPAHGDLDGYSAGIEGRWYYRFQSYGTLGKAIRPKRPGHKRSHAPGMGITPNLMFQKARTAGRRKLKERIQQGP